MRRGGCWPWAQARRGPLCVRWPGWGRRMQASRWPRCVAPFSALNGALSPLPVRHCRPGWRRRSAGKPRVADYSFDLGQDDQRDGLEYVRARTGRSTHLLEKDVWVVWSQRALFESPLSADLTFKGGTSLSLLTAIRRDPTHVLRALAAGWPTRVVCRMTGVKSRAG